MQLPASVMLDPEAEPPADEPETIPDSYWPDGLDDDYWSSFVHYRARKV